MDFRVEIVLFILVLITIFEWLNIKFFSRITSGIIRLPVYCFETTTVLYIAYRYLNLKSVMDFDLFEFGTGLNYWFFHIFLIWLTLNLVIGIIRFYFIRDKSIFLEISFYNTVIFPLYLLCYKFPDYTYSFSSTLSFHQGLPCACAQCPPTVYKVFYFFRIRNCILEFSLFMLVMISLILLTDWLENITGREKKIIIKDTQIKNSMIRTAEFSFLVIITSILVFIFEFFIIKIVGHDGYWLSSTLTFCVYLTILVIYFNFWNMSLRDILKLDKIQEL